MEVTKASNVRTINITVSSYSFGYVKFGAWGLVEEAGMFEGTWVVSNQGSGFRVQRSSWGSGLGQRVQD